MKYGIDVSFWRGRPDWSKAKANVDFAILAVTERFNKIDSTFEYNYQGCKENNIPVGAYSYSYAIDGDDSKRYAEMVVDALKGKKIDLPVFLDLEWEGQESLSQSTINEIITQFRDVIVNAGYKFGIYCNKDWYSRRIPDFAKKYILWLSWPNVTGNTCLEYEKPDYPNMAIWQYSFTGKVPGFGDDDVDMDVFYGITEDQTDEQPETGVTAEDALNVIRAWVGRSESDGSHKAIIDIYNNHTPLAQGYRLSYSDSWCDATVSAVFISLSATDLIGGTECGVERHVQLFRAAGIWNEDGNITPVPGDIIVFNWDENAQPNDGFSDHIGMVEYVEGTIIHTIEGNAGGAVRRRTYRIGAGTIRGYARPKYTTTSQEAPERPETSHETTTEDLPMLSQWSAGEAVRTLQKALNGFGYSLDVDGDFGPLTRAAVINFQKIHGLEVDGIVGPITWGELLTRKTVEELAQEVLDKKWGNDPERSKRLTEAGYDAKAVQAEVNRLWTERMNEWK